MSRPRTARGLRRFGVALVLAVAAPSHAPVLAEIVPVGEEIELVGGFTASVQNNVHVAGAADGSLMLVWASDVADGGNVFVRRFDRYGAALGTDVLVNDPSTERVAQEPYIAAPADGRFAVAWLEYRSDDPYATPDRVLVRIFDPAGEPVTAAFPTAVSEPTSPRRFAYARIAISDAGELAVACVAYGDYGVRPQLLAQRLTDNGTPIGGTIVVDTAPGFKNAALAYGDAGELFVGWVTDYDVDCGYIGSVYANSVSVERFLGGVGTGRRAHPLYDFAGYCGALVEGSEAFDLTAQGPGQFVVASNVADPGYYVIDSYPHYWDPYPSSFGLHASRFVHDEAQPSRFVGDDAGYEAFTTGLAAASTKRGNFLVVWGKDSGHAPGEGVEGADVFASPFGCRGAADTPFEFRVNTQYSGDQMWPDVAWAGGNEFIVTWLSRTSQDRLDVVGRRYALEGRCSTCGDVDDDGALTASDALAALRGALDLGPCEPWLCDVISEGRITAADALVILRAASGIQPNLTCPSFTS